MAAGPGSAILEPLTNYSFFKQGPIVPRFEENKVLALRKKFNQASRAGKGISYMLSPLFREGDSVDPRYIDNLFSSVFSYYGDFGMNVSDIGSPVSRHKFGLKTLGFFREQAIYSDVRVEKLYNLAEDLGLTGSTEIKHLGGYISDYYNATTAEQRERSHKMIMKYAAKIYESWLKHDKYNRQIKSKGQEINFK